MSSVNIAHQPPQAPPLPNWLRQSGLGFLYWLAFLLVLEPDNALRALQAGYRLQVDHEALRISAAALLGALVTPAVLLLTRRFPLLGDRRWRNGLVHALGTTGLAAGLIVISCFLAAWGFQGQWLPSAAEIRDQLVCNWLLLVYALAAFTAIAHAVYFFHRARTPRPLLAPAPVLTRVPVKSRGRLSHVSLSEVDWIEAQGNYLALHAGSAVHMIRETLASFEARLDASRFVRIHRRAIVAVDRIAELQPVANGDALVRLAGGQELRASRSYRNALREKWDAQARTEQ